MAEKEKVVICIIARMNSTRLPEKVIADLNGHPMNKVLIERLKSCQNVDEIIYCTTTEKSDDRLAEMAESWGVPVHRGEVNDVLKRIKDGAEAHGAHHLLRVTGDNILTDPEYIDIMIEQHLKHRADYTRTHELPLGCTAEVMSLAMANRLHRDLTDPEQTEYMVLFAFDPDRYKCLVIEPENNAVKRPNYAITIDTPRDMEQVRAIFKAFPKKEWGPNLSDAVAFLDDYPDRIELDDSEPIKMPYGEIITYKAFKERMRDKAKKATCISV